MAEASRWVARIATTVVVMVLPARGGHWLDDRLGTGFFVLVGMVLGLTVGMYYLLLVTGALTAAKSRGNRRRGDRP